MRLKSYRKLALLAGLAGIVLCPGCAAYRPTQSGYLSDYSQLQKDPIHLNYGLGLQRVNARNADQARIQAIDSYYIEPVTWMVSDSSRAGRDPERRELLIKNLEEALRTELGTVKPIVDKPGPNTARVRSVITDVMLSKPYLNILLTATLITPVPIGPLFNGGGLIEAEVVGPDGRQISAVSVASGGGMLDVFGYYHRSRHASQAMRRAAWELRETLEK